MNKLLSCRYNMDTNRVEARFEDETTLAIDCIAIEDEYGNTPAQRAELDWLLYNKPLGSMPSLCWVGRLSIISRLVATTAGWKSNDITNTAPLWRRRSQSGAVFNEGEMKGISGHRFSSNCSAVTVALPSAAKMMPSADWGV